MLDGKRYSGGKGEGTLSGEANHLFFSGTAHVFQFPLQTLRLFVGAAQLVLDLLPPLPLGVQRSLGLVQRFAGVSQRALAPL